MPTLPRVLMVGFCAAILPLLSGCSVVSTAADVAGTAVSTTVSVAGSAVRTTADVVTGGPSDDKDKKKDDSARQ